MTPDETLRSLLAAAADVADEQGRAEARVAARIAWVHETIAALKEAQQRVCDAWDRILDALPEDLDEEELEAMDIPDPPEQAELDALHALIDDVRERDLWPKHLYWGDV